MLKSLRFRLILLVLVAVAPVAGLVVHSAAEQGRAGAERVKADVLRLVRLAGAQEDRLIDGARQLLAALASAPELRSPDRKIAERFLGDIARRNPAFASLAVAGVDGRILASVLEVPEGVNVSDRSYMKRALATREFAVGDYQMGRTTVPLASLNLGYPVLGADGAAEFVLIAAIGLNWAADLIRGAELPADSVLTIVDRQGLVLGRYPDPHGMFGKTFPDAPLIRVLLSAREGSMEVKGLDGVDRLYAFTSLGDPRAPTAYLSIGYPAEAIYAPAREFLVGSLLALAIVTAAGMAVAWFFGETLFLKRVRALAGVADRLSAGRLDEEADVRGGDELAALGETFNRMARRLKEQIQERERANRGLEERVAGLVLQRTRELSLLNELGDLLQACQSLEEAYAMIGRAAGAIFSDERGSVYLASASRNLVERVARWGPDEAGPPAFAPEECWALRRGQAHFIERAEDPALCRHLTSPVRVPSLCRPLAAHGETLGILHLAGGADRLPEEKRRLASTVAESVALALANLRLRDSLRRQSVRDPLTDLFNRRHLEETLEREVRRAARNKAPLGVLMMDVDHFKRFNDTFGHAAGDLVLRQMGNLLRGRSRGGDLPCRYGGEELALVLPDTDLEGALAKAEQVRKDTADLALEAQGRPLGQVTVSIGVAVFPRHGASGEDLLAAADAALYKAKKAGRNRVLAAE